MRAWAHCWESAGLGRSHQYLRELKQMLRPTGDGAGCVVPVVGVLRHCCLWQMEGRGLKKENRVDLLQLGVVW